MTYSSVSQISLLRRITWVLLNLALSPGDWFRGLQWVLTFVFSPSSIGIFTILEVWEPGYMKLFFSLYALHLLEINIFFGDKYSIFNNRNAIYILYD